MCVEEIGRATAGADQGAIQNLVKGCVGIAVVTVFKGGLFFIGGQGGTGCVLKKIKDEHAPAGYRWSGPISVTMGGLEGGFIFGAEKITSIVIFNSESALDAFVGTGQLQLGVSASLAVGPFGREVAASIGVGDKGGVAPAVSYSTAQGAYIGGVIDGTAWKVNRKDMNAFYGKDGKDVEVRDVFDGMHETPYCAAPLFEALMETCA